MLPVVFNFFAAGDRRDVVGTRTTHLSSQKIYCWLDSGDFVSSRSSDYTSMIHFNKGMSSS